MGNSKHNQWSGWCSMHTAIPYREVQSFPGKSPQWKQDPCNENRDPCNENRFFPVRIDLQGVPSKPYTVWVCSVQKKMLVADIQSSFMGHFQMYIFDKLGFWQQKQRQVCPDSKQVIPTIQMNEWFWMSYFVIRLKQQNGHCIVLLLFNVLLIKSSLKNVCH